MWNVCAWLFFFFFLITLLVLVVYQLLCLTDLEFDYINPYDTATRINKVVLPEFIVQGTLCFLYLVTGHWVMSLFCVPYLYYNVRSYRRRQHLIDVTEVFNLLRFNKKIRVLKLTNIVLLFCISLYWLIYALLDA